MCTLLLGVSAPLFAAEGPIEIHGHYGIVVDYHGGSPVYHFFDTKFEAEIAYYNFELAHGRKSGESAHKLIELLSRTDMDPALRDRAVQDVTQVFLKFGVPMQIPAAVSALPWLFKILKPASLPYLLQDIAEMQIPNNALVLRTIAVVLARNISEMPQGRKFGEGNHAWALKELLLNTRHSNHKDFLNKVTQAIWADSAATTRLLKMAFSDHDDRDVASESLLALAELSWVNHESLKGAENVFRSAGDENVQLAAAAVLVEHSINDELREKALGHIVNFVREASMDSLYFPGERPFITARYVLEEAIKRKKDLKLPLGIRFKLKRVQFNEGCGQVLHHLISR